MNKQAVCKLCGEPMPAGEEMFFYHGFSGPCPKPPLPKRRMTVDPKSFDLAERFLSDFTGVTEDEKRDLAEAIQRAVEDFLSGFPPSRIP